MLLKMVIILAILVSSVVYIAGHAIDTTANALKTTTYMIQGIPDMEGK